MHLQRSNPSLGCKIFAVKYICNFFPFFNEKKFANRSNSRKTNQISLEKKIFPKISQSFVKKKATKFVLKKSLPLIGRTQQGVVAGSI
jgi:hypothetical protein